MYYLLLPDLDSRSQLIDELRRLGVHAVFHYVPLHASAAGRRYGRPGGDLGVTENASERLVRLPLWAGMKDQEVERVVDAVHSACASIRTRSSARVRSS
jgi:dTDP-4-amino-4,6-dideoxygalactose transaminase